MKNKKGLTLVELLAVVVILGIIALVTLSVVSNVISKQKEKTYYSQLNQLILSGQNWAIDNPRKFLADNCNSENKNYQKLTLETLQNEGYLSDKFVDTTSNNNLNFSNENTFVYVYKFGKGYLYCVESPKCNKPKYIENKNTASNICCNGSEIKQMLEAENCQVPSPSNDETQNQIAPTVTITNTTSTTSSITVSYTITNADDFTVQYWTTNPNAAVTVPKNANCTISSCTFTGLTSGTTYNIKVTAINTSNSLSAEDSTTKATTTSSGGGAVVCPTSDSEYTSCGRCSTSGTKKCETSYACSRTFTCTPCVPSYTDCKCASGGYYCYDVNNCSLTTEVADKITGTIPSGKCCYDNSLHSTNYCNCMDACKSGSNLGGQGNSLECYNRCSD